MQLLWGELERECMSGFTDAIKEELRTTQKLTPCAHPQCIERYKRYLSTWIDSGNITDRYMDRPLKQSPHCYVLMEAI
jgi:hypothetical protein